MTKTDLTQADVEALIAATHSDPQSDPYSSEAGATLDRFCWSQSPFAASDVQIWHANAGSYDWTPDNIELILGEKVTEERLDELVNGVEPTGKERDLFEELAQEKSAWGADWAAHIYRLVVPNSSTEHRAVFFVHINIELGQMNEGISCAGPFHTMDEAQEYVEGQYDGEDELVIDDVESLRATLLGSAQ